MLRKGFEVVHTDKSSDTVLRNLFEFYLHDLAEWFKFDQLPEGRYTQSTERYWQDGHDVHVWRLHPGPWLVRVYAANEPALPFWRAAVSGFTEDEYVEATRRKDGKLWSYFNFESRQDR